MKKSDSILLIVDDSAKMEDFRRASVLFKGKYIFLIVLTHNVDLRMDVGEVLCELNKGNKVRYIDFGDYFHKNSFSKKEAFIKFIYEFSTKPIFGNKTLKEYFRVPCSDFSAWWLSLIAEKNSARSYSYNNLIKLISFLEIKDKFSLKKIYSYINDRELISALRSNSRKRGFVFKDIKNLNDKSVFFNPLSFFINGLRYYRNYIKRVFIIKSKIKNFKERYKSIKDIFYLLVAYFPCIDKKLMDQGVFIDSNYRPLQAAIKKRYKDKYFWLALIPDVDMKVLEEDVELINEINSLGDLIFSFEEFLKIRDLPMILFQYTCISIKFFLKKRRVSRRFVFPEPSVNIWDIFADDWHSSFCGKHLIEGITYMRIFRNISRILKGHVNIMYFLEMKSWENALNVEISRNKELRSIGIQHTTVPLLFLPRFHDKAELKGRDFINDLPMPTRLACAGKNDYEIFKRYGWNEEKLFIFGAMRYERFSKYFNGYMPWEKRGKNILVALSIMQKEVEDMLVFIYEAFRRSRGYKIIIKPHPWQPVSDLTRALGIELDNAIFEITDKGLDELMTEAKVMVVAGSSSCLDAIACQCPVIIPRLINFIDINPLSGISDLPIYVSDPEELKGVSEKIINSEVSPLSSDECKKFIKDYLVLPESESEYLVRLEEALSYD